MDLPNNVNLDSCSEALSRQFVEKVYEYCEKPEEIEQFNDHELIMLMQLLVKGAFLNDKNELCFYLGKHLGRLVEHFVPTESQIKEARRLLIELRAYDREENVDLTEAVSNYVNRVVITSLKA